MITFNQEYIDDNKIRMLICFCINTVGLMIGTFLVIKGSPKHMGLYKYILLDIIFWSYFMDLITTLLWMPLSAMPAPSICISGLMKDLGNYSGNALCLAIFMFSFGGCGVASNLAIYFQLCALRAQNLDVFAKKSVVFLLFCLHVFSTLPIIGSFYYGMDLNGYSFEDLRDFHITNYPFMKDIVFLIPCGGFIIDETHKKAFAFLGITLVTVLIHVFIGVFNISRMLFHLRKIGKRKKTITKKDEFQKQLFIALLLQAMLPVLCLGVPYTIVVIEVILRDETLADLGTLSLTIGSLHSFLHTIVLATVIKPYRNMIFRRKSKTTILTTQNNMHLNSRLSILRTIRSNSTY